MVLSARSSLDLLIIARPPQGVKPGEAAALRKALPKGETLTGPREGPVLTTCILGLELSRRRRHHPWYGPVRPAAILRQRRRNMRQLGQVAVNFLKSEDGPTAVEYAVMLALIIVVCIAAVTTLGSNANGTFSDVGSAVNVGS
jgi:pilus assembly protein Flp/PilA